MEILITLLAIAIVAILVFIYSSFSWGFVVYKFWGWFLLPVFPQLPHITFWQAVGLSFVISLFKGTQTSIKSEYKEANSDLCKTIITPWVTLIIAYFIYSIFM